MKITITFPLIKKWKSSRKVRLTRHQAMTISAMLEQYRLNLIGEKYEQGQVRKSEDVLDAQLWGTKYVEGRKSWN